jgi:hypothetical protein
MEKIANLTQPAKVTALFMRNGEPAEAAWR